jgi:hypothetical protein
VVWIFPYGACTKRLVCRQLLEEQNESQLGRRRFFA